MWLSVKGKALLKGRFRERIELMHLALNSTYSCNGIPIVSSKVPHMNNASGENAKENQSIHANACDDASYTKEGSERTSSSSVGSVKSTKSATASVQYANPFLIDDN